MQEKESTSQESPEVNSISLIDGYYKKLKAGIDVLLKMKQANVPKVYVFAQQLDIVCNYSLLDIVVSARALLFQCGDFESKYHLANLNTSLIESFKAIFNIKKNMAKPIWKHFGVELRTLNDCKLNERYERIDRSLYAFKNDIKQQDKDLRDSTCHFDEDMTILYKKLESLIDPKLLLSKEVKYKEIVLEIMSLTECVIDKAPGGIPKFVEHCSSLSVGDEVLRKGSDEYNKLVETADNIICEASKWNECLMTCMKEAKKFNECLREKEECATKAFNRPIKFPTDEYDSYMTFSNANMLWNHMRGNLAAIMKAFLNSVSVTEQKMHLRRFIVYKVNTIQKLYGYSVEERDKAIWAKVKEIVSKSCPELMPEYDEIEKEILQKITKDREDENLRAAMLHLTKGKKFTLSTSYGYIESIDPINEINKATEFFKLINIVNSFLKKVDDVLEQKEREAIPKLEKIRDETMAFVCSMLDAADLKS